MTIRIPVIATIGLLAGCASTEQVRTVRVEVPVATPCPAPVLPPRPHLPLADLPPDASAADIARAAVASMEALKGHVKAIETAVAP